MGLNKRTLPKTSVSGYTPEPNILAHLDLNNTNSYSGSGSTITDLTGNGYNGTISNASFTSGTPNYLNFSGTSTSNVIINSNNPSFSPNSGNITFMFWMYKTITNYATFVSKGTISSYEVDINVGFGGGINSPYRATYYRSTGSATAVAYSTVTQTLNTWVNVAVVYDDNVDRVRVYLNGTKIVTSAVYGGRTISANTGFLKIGGRNDNNHSFTGRFAELKMFSAPLSDSEILTSYNLNKSIYGH